MKNPITREQAVEIARDYLLTRTIADFEAGPSRHQRFARELREDGIDDAALKRIASATVYGPRKCGFHSNVYDFYDDPIALQGYRVYFNEFVSDIESPNDLTVRMLEIVVSYCGTVLQGKLAPRFRRAHGKKPSSSPNCK